VTGRELVPKLIGWIDRRIDVPPKLFLGGRDRMHNILERRVTDHEKVDVAGRAKFVSRRRSEHERDLNRVAERRKRVAQDVDESRSLRKQPAQLGEYWRTAVGLEVDLTSLHGSMHQPCTRQQLQFPLHGADRSAGLTCNLPKVVRLVSVTEQPSENPTAGAAEEHRCRVHRCGSR
jgi:hypothetical protein